MRRTSAAAAKPDAAAAHAGSTQGSGVGGGAAAAAAGMGTGGWEEAQDAATGQTYFWNPTTNETVWERPPEMAGLTLELAGAAAPPGDDAAAYGGYIAPSAADILTEVNGGEAGGAPIPAPVRFADGADL